MRKMYNLEFIGWVGAATLFLFIGCGVWAEIMVHGKASKNNSFVASIIAIIVLPLAVGLAVEMAVNARKPAPKPTVAIDHD